MPKIQTVSLLSSKESSQYLKFNWKDSRKPTHTSQSDKNGTTKETKEKDLKEKEKLPKRTTDVII